MVRASQAHRQRFHRPHKLSLNHNPSQTSKRSVNISRSYPTLCNTKNFNESFHAHQLGKFNVSIKRLMHSTLKGGKPLSPMPETNKEGSNPSSRTSKHSNNKSSGSAAAPTHQTGGVPGNDHAFDFQESLVKVVPRASSRPAFTNADKYKSAWRIYGESMKGKAAAEMEPHARVGFAAAKKQPAVCDRSAPDTKKDAQVDIKKVKNEPDADGDIGTATKESVPDKQLVPTPTTVTPATLDPGFIYVRHSAFTPEEFEVICAGMEIPSARNGRDGDVLRLAHEGGKGSGLGGLSVWEDEEAEEEWVEGWDMGGLGEEDVQLKHGTRGFGIDWKKGL